MTDEEILQIDFYDLCGNAAVFMTNKEKIDYWRNMSGIFQQSSPPKNITKQVHYGSCEDCEWEDKLSNAELDYDWDEFKQIEIAFPICPNCGGNLEFFTD